jgi:photosystem II stability/assembly factor-like uncharacterized protein
MSSTILNTPAQFGPANGVDSKDYILHKEGPRGVTDRPVNLLGHSLTSPSQDLTDALVFTTVKLRNGRVVTVSRVKRAPQETSRTYTIGIPSALWTPVLEASYSGGCVATFYLIYQCPEDRIYNHWDILPEGVLSPAIEAEDVITTGTDDNMITFTSDLQVPEKLRGWMLGYEPIYDGGAIAYQGIFFISENCPGCNTSTGMDLIAVGGDGIAAPTVTVTDDRFGSVTNPSVGAVGDVAFSVYNDGLLQLVGIADNADPSLATAASLERSTDGGTNWSTVLDVDDVIRFMFKADQVIYAIGHTIAGAAVIWMSADNGSSFTEITSTALPAADALLMGAYDELSGKTYFVGESGTLLTGTLSGSALTLTDISANLPGTPGDLYVCISLGANNVLVAGAAGYVAETWDAAVTFTAISFPAVTDITAGDGNQYRVVLGATTNLYERTALTMNDFEAIELENAATITGNVTSIRMNHDGDFNRFAAVTDAGEVAFGKPFYPNA